jgi:hypothetical protein
MFAAKSFTSCRLVVRGDVGYTLQPHNRTDRISQGEKVLPDAE